MSLPLPLDAPPATREAHFGRYAKRAPAAFASAKAESPPRPSKPATLEDLRSFSTPLSSVIDRPDAESAAKRAKDKDLADGKKWKQVEFYISIGRSRSRMPGAVSSGVSASSRRISAS